MAKHEHLTIQQAVEAVKAVRGVDPANVDERVAMGPIGAYMQIPGPHPTIDMGQAADGSYWVEIPEIVIEPTS